MAEREFKLPDLGEGLTDGEVVRWLVAEGDAIELNQPIVEVETAKAVVEIPAPYAGTVVKLHAVEGESLDVGAPLISVDTAGGAGSPAAGAAAGAVAAEPEPDPEPAQELQATLVGPGERQQVRRRRIGGHARSANGPATTPRRVAAQAGAARAGAPRTGLALTWHRPDGLHPRRTSTALDAGDGGPPRWWALSPPPRGGESDPVAPRRPPLPSIPHVTEFDRLRTDAAAPPAPPGPRWPGWPGAGAAVRSYPLMNSSWDEAAGDIVVKGRVNLGIATDTPTGLLVPNIKDADTLGILDLSRELTRLTELARERKAAPADLTGGTITITNVGGFGVETGTPIINKPECAILATGLIAPRPWVVDGQLAVRQLMTTSVSFDHRIVDGAYAAQFLAHLRDLLEDPALLSAF